MEHAIFEAVLAEIDDVGYESMTMESVAIRAHAGKASLYRRWPDKIALVRDTVYHRMPGPEAFDTGSLRGDLLRTLKAANVELSGSVGSAMRGLIGESLLDPVRRERFRKLTEGRTATTIRSAVQRAVERGEIDAALVNERKVETGPALLRQQFLFGHDAVTNDFLKEVVDDVLLPLFGIGR
nr:TetR/AcrR family transcriptional regulator [Spelaeicoccus albus]